MAFKEDGQDFYVVKRDGSYADVRIDAITDRNEMLCTSAFGGRELSTVKRKLTALTMAVMRRFRNGMSTEELDMLTASICAEKSTRHKDYSDLAARIIVSDMHKKTERIAKSLDLCDINEYLNNIDAFEYLRPNLFSTDLRYSITHVAAMLMKYGGQIHEEMFHIMVRASKQIDERIQYSRDYNFDCFAINNMLRMYQWSLTINGEDYVVERPQHVYMRTALAHFCSEVNEIGERVGHLADDNIFYERLEEAFAEYELLSTQMISFGSPAFINSGSKHQQTASCFLTIPDDDMDSLDNVVSMISKLSRKGGGIGFCVTPMRKEGAKISSTGDESDGPIPYLRHVESTLHFAKQRRRKGAGAAYISIWHANVIDHIEAGRFKDVDEMRNAPDLKYGLWVPDIFMKSLFAELQKMIDNMVREQGENIDEKWQKMLTKAEKVLPEDEAGDWYLMCPKECPKLLELYGDDFEDAYREYVRQGKFTKKTKTSHIMIEWFKTVSAKGSPYILFGDTINKCSNLAHIQKLLMSNLCSEITVPSCYDEHNPDSAEIGVCVLGSIVLANFVVNDSRAAQGVKINWQALVDAVAVSIKALDRSINNNFYPVEPARRSNFRHRPLGLGLIGLADVFARFKYAFGSAEAKELDQALCAVIYYSAMKTSSDLGRILGNFKTFDGSWTQRGYLQPDISVEQGFLDQCWERNIANVTDQFLTSDMWTQLRQDCSQYMRNSYVTAYMPTATSAISTGQNSCFEPFDYVMQTRKTLAGEHIVFNKHFLQEMEELGLWSDQMRRSIIAGNGSIQHIIEIPAQIRHLYRTVREIDQRLITEHAAARQPFCTQSQSLNYYWESPKLMNLLSVICYGWHMGLTTGSYYHYSQPAEGSQQTSIINMSKISTSSSDKPITSTTNSINTSSYTAFNSPVCMLGEDCTSCGG